MGHCVDCGERTSNGICSNCHEAHYICTFQGDYIDHQLSDEFVAKAEAQRRDVERQKQIRRERG